jgi:hypothetical protein
MEKLNSAGVSGQDLQKMTNRLRNGANWFYWIAALSVVNMVILGFKGTTNFVIGLGITLFIDIAGNELASTYGMTIKIIAVAINLVIAGIFVVFGVFSNKRKSWAFIVGMSLYSLDALLYLYLQDFLSFGFHVFALVNMFLGLTAINKIMELEAQEASVQIVPETPQGMETQPQTVDPPDVSGQ